MTAAPSSDRTAPPDLLAHALAAHDAGLCVLPPKQDGSKQPDAASWARFRRERPDRDEIGRWYAGGHRTGIGYVCGAVSGNLEMLEVEDRGTYEAFAALAAAAGLGPVLERVAAGYLAATPGGGVHLLYRCAEVAGNAKLARRSARAGERRHPGDAVRVLIETRGEGGFTVEPPSRGGVHPSGDPYVQLRGGVATIAEIAVEERADLWALARTMDELAGERRPAEPAAGSALPGAGARPGDDYNARTDWPDVLEAHGWVALWERGGVTSWRRPGKDRGVSATTNYAGSDLLYVFTTSTPFDAERSYTRFGAHAVLDHGGDFAAAARALAVRGYGRRPDTGGSPAAAAAPPAPLPPVPPFPLEALPPVARAFVRDGADALGCPSDFVALPLLAFCGAVAGNARRLRLKPGFAVAPIFWTGVVGKPGTVKTPALNLARRPLDALQKEAWDRYKAELEAWEGEKAAERGARPRPEHFFATDTTTEAVAAALVTSRGLAVVHDELAGWVKAFDAYRKAGDRQTWLSAWSGAPLKPNRKTGEPIYVPDPVVCVTGGIQPDVLAELAGEAARDDGFVPRLLLAWPDAEPAPWTEEVVGDRVVADMLRVVAALRLPGEQTVVTALAPDAYGEWVRWFDENQRLVAGARGLAAGWGAKAPVHLARIALVLHLLAHPDDHARPLGAGTLRDAIAVAEYVRAHLGRVLPAFGAPGAVVGAGLAARALRVLGRAAPGWVGRAELAARLGGHEPSPAVGAALEELRARGRAERRAVPTAGRGREEWRATGADPDGDGDPARDKGKDGESLPDPSFPRNRVITEQPDAEPGAGWERWEEPL